ncbi:MAG TPA: TfoX/Sxy family protein [Vicinamibacterales bacterium]|nr:TfoX/Sxy family protein [Vicinamibacterales bacterium]
MSRPATSRRRPPSREPLKAMRVSPSFHDFVVDQLSAVKGLRTRAMFGGVGIYAEDVFFALVARDELYLKVDDSNRDDYAAAGGRPFQPYEHQAMTMSYYSVPAPILEDPEALMRWARRSLALARTRHK